MHNVMMRSLSHGANLTEQKLSMRKFEGGHLTPSMVGVGFAFRWQNRDLYDFYDGMRTTMPQSAPGGLSANIYAGLVAFTLARNGYPAGDTELATDADLLRRIPHRSSVLKRFGGRPPNRFAPAARTRTGCSPRSAATRASSATAGSNCPSGPW